MYPIRNTKILSSMPHEYSNNNENTSIINTMNTSQYVSMDL